MALGGQYSGPLLGGLPWVRTVCDGGETAASASSCPDAVQAFCLRCGLVERVVSSPDLQLCGAGRQSSPLASTALVVAAESAGYGGWLLDGDRTAIAA